MLGRVRRGEQAFHLGGAQDGREPLGHAPPRDARGHGGAIEGDVVGEAQRRRIDAAGGGGRPPGIATGAAPGRPRAGGRGGWQVLARAGSALEAVVAAEDAPHFNAGLGSVLTVEGRLEMDASVMAGETLPAGAVGVVSGVANPIRLARAVLAEGREVLLVGEAAAALAARHGLPRCPPEALMTEEARRRWQERRPATGETVGPWPAMARATARQRPRRAASLGSAAAGSGTPR